jgi:hypothetical protein
MTTWCLCCALAVLLLVAAAHAQTAHTVMHEGATYAIDVADQVLTITFLEPPADLRELGAVRGGLLVKGKWTPYGVLEGDAYAFAPSCPPIAYPVRGIVNQASELIVIGPQPVLQDCKITGSQWTEGSIMRFSLTRPVSDQRKAETKPKAKAKAKPKPEPKTTVARPRPQAPAVVRQPWENQWQWR